MLRIRIDLLPFGLTSVPKDTWIMEIANDGTSTDKSIGNYIFKIFIKNSNDRLLKGGEIKNFQRKRWSVWYLLYLCLHKVYGENK